MMLDRQTDRQTDRQKERKNRYGIQTIFDLQMIRP